MAAPIIPIGSGSARPDPPARLVDPKAAKPKGKAGVPKRPAKPKGKAAPKPAAKTKAAPKSTSPKEVDVSKLSDEELSKRCREIYKLEKRVEGKLKLHELAKKGARAAREALSDAEEALSKEIREQRLGPGPLFPADGESA